MVDLHFMQVFCGIYENIIIFEFCFRISTVFCQETCRNEDVVADSQSQFQTRSFTPPGKPGFVQG
jgi:hypothetical protein